jgi:hypothetical protein
VSCEVDKPSFALALPQKLSNKFYCVLKPKESKEPVPSQITLTVTVSSLDSSDTYTLSKRFDIPFMNHFTVITPRHITLFSDKRSSVIEVNSNSNFQVETSGNLLVSKEQVGNSNLYRVKVSVPDTLMSDSNEYEVIFYNPQLQTKESVYIKYKHSSESYASSSSSSNYQHEYKE